MHGGMTATTHPGDPLVIGFEKPADTEEMLPVFRLAR